MKKQALLINTWGKNIYVKIPVVNSKGVFMGKIIKELNNQNIKLNITDDKVWTKSIKNYHCADPNDINTCFISSASATTTTTTTKKSSHVLDESVSREAVMSGTP